MKKRRGCERKARQRRAQTTATTSWQEMKKRGGSWKQGKSDRAKQAAPLSRKWRRRREEGGEEERRAEPI